MMNLLELFKIKKKPSTAAIAKERLQIIVSHERAKKSSPDYLPKLQKEIVEVIAKYVQIDQDLVHVNFQNIGECSILELNITLPEMIPEEVA